jgi:hypothetical protein
MRLDLIVFVNYRFSFSLNYLLVLCYKSFNIGHNHQFFNVNHFDLLIIAIFYPYLVRLAVFEQYVLFNRSFRNKTFYNGCFL